MNEEMGHHDDFISEEELQKEFTQAFDKRVDKGNKGLAQQKDFRMWYTEGQPDPKTYDHHDQIPDGRVYSCETIIDKWWQWFLSTPRQMNPFVNPGNVGSERAFFSYSSANAFLFSKNN